MLDLERHSISRSGDPKTKALGNLITRPELADCRFNCLNSAQIVW